MITPPRSHLQLADDAQSICDLPWQRAKGDERCRDGRLLNVRGKADRLADPSKYAQDIAVLPVGSTRAGFRVLMVGLFVDAQT